MLGDNPSRLRLNLFLLSGLFLLGACAGTKPVHPPLATVEGKPGRFAMGRIIQLKTGQSVTFETLMEQLDARAVVFVGEVHDNPEHHLIQVQILQALTDRYGPMPVAMEFFRRPQQPVIDRYMSGEMGEDTFLREVDWQKNWGFDYHFYRPLVQHAKAGGERLLAINAPAKVVRKVARKGLQALSPEERAQLASQIDLNNAAHREYLRDIYRLHAHGSLKNFDFFYQAQCVWEDTMAESIAAYLRTNGGRMAVFCGNGHIANRYGVPDRTASRISTGMAVIVLHPLSEDVAFDEKTADYVWLTGDAPRRPPMRMPLKHGKPDGPRKE